MTRWRRPRWDLAIACLCASALVPALACTRSPAHRARERAHAIHSWLATADMIERAHRAGAVPHVYTVNALDAVARALESERDSAAAAAVRRQRATIAGTR